jgi:hypothetical protein
MSMTCRLFVLAIGLSALGGCVGDTERVCVAHAGRSCTSYEFREIDRGRMHREVQEAAASAEASSGGTPWLRQRPGEAASEYLNRPQGPTNRPSSGASGAGGYSGGGSNVAVDGIGQALRFLFGKHGKDGT